MFGMNGLFVVWIEPRVATFSDHVLDVVSLCAEEPA